MNIQKKLCHNWWPNASVRRNSYWTIKLLFREAYLKPSRTFKMELFCEISEQFLAVNYIHKKAPLQMFDCDSKWFASSVGKFNNKFTKATSDFFLNFEQIHAQRFGFCLKDHEIRAYVIPSYHEKIELKEHS